MERPAVALLHDARLVHPGGGVDDTGWLQVTGDVITAAGTGPPPAGLRSVARLHDLGGRFVVPGFVDLHVHGGGGASYTGGTRDGAEDADGLRDEARRVVAFHRSHGTTTALASLVSAPPGELTTRMRTLAPLVEEGLVAGIHLEGPFLSPARRGAHDPAALCHPDPVTLDALLEAGGAHLRMMTVAPELPGGLEAIRRLVRHDVIAAIGHTDADHAGAHAAFEAGASVVTHLCNAMPPMHHRAPGAVAAALTHPGVTVELINDGVHVHPAMIALAFAAAGPDRVALVTDAIGAAGLEDGTYALGAMTVRVTGGVARLAGAADVLAGSTLTQDAALRRAVLEAGIPLPDAVAAVTATPARVLGLADRIGSLQTGRQADLVVLSADLLTVAVMVRGRWVPGPWREPI